MINFDEVIGENTQEQNPLWPQILYRILIEEALDQEKLM